MNRTYIFERQKRGIKDRTILEKASDDTGSPRDTAALSLPRGLPDEVYGDVLAAIQDAYRNGREDREAELIPGDSRADLLRSMVCGAAISAMQARVAGWQPVTDIVQHRIALDHYDAASHALTFSIGTEHTFPLGRYEVRLLVEKKGPAMIREEKFVLSRGQYAVDLSALNAEIDDEGRSAWCYVRAAWYRRKDGVLRACLGNLSGLMKPPPADAAGFLARYDHDAWGGHCEGRWDGTRYWGAQEPEVIARHLALLRPMLDGFPVIPEGHDGWWRFLTTAELRKKRGLPA